MLHHQAGAPAKLEHDPHEGVDGDLGHDAAHQRGDVARRRRVRQRQPGVQRHDAGFRSGADQRQDQREGADRRGWMRGAHRVETVKSAGAGEQAEAEQQSKRAEARHDQINVAGVDVLRHAMMRHHQRPRRQRHEFPAQQEGESIVGQAPRASCRRETPRRTAARVAAPSRARRSRARTGWRRMRRGRPRSERTPTARRGGNGRRARARRAAARRSAAARRRVDAAAAAINEIAVTIMHAPYTMRVAAAKRQNATATTASASKAAAQASAIVSVTAVPP